MLIEYCEKCGSKISQEMARASETHCEGQTLCIRCQKKWLNRRVKVGKYPKKLADYTKYRLNKYEKIPDYWLAYFEWKPNKQIPLI